MLNSRPTKHVQTAIYIAVLDFASILSTFEYAMKEMWWTIKVCWYETKCMYKISINHYYEKHVQWPSSIFSLFTFHSYIIDSSSWCHVFGMHLRRLHLTVLPWIIFEREKYDCSCYLLHYFWSITCLLNSGSYKFISVNQKHLFSTPMIFLSCFISKLIFYIHRSSPRLFL